MSAVLAPLRGVHAHRIDVRPIEPDDVPRLRLPSARSAYAMRQEIQEYPGRSVWVPATLEYAAVTPWRNRAEIAHLSELVAVRHAEQLLQAAFERCRTLGDDLFVALELENQRSPTQFERAGMHLLEEVITYDMQTPRVCSPPRADIKVIPVRAQDDRAVSIVTGIDRAAFPWLWRNGRAEFDEYLCTPGVEVCLLFQHEEPVAYVGLTHFSGWGHLDRIAVDPARQGAGIGLSALHLAVDSMRRRGARRVGLSTQRKNQRSQRLYERFGFRRTFENDYRLYGRWTDPERESGEAPS